MREATVNKEVNNEVRFEDFRDELLQFLARRFGSIPLAERIYNEMERRIAGSDMLALVGSPKVYLSSYGLSLGLQFLQEELKMPKQRGVL
ncbi:MAG: hypothetical protein EOO52_09450 [Gammaproteobacteria bacterium]|nr:MAG: hypothetical protein EOO52_09450 [Gammaproteobacteria bacterium]